MNVNPEIVVSGRERRAWSQDHLAEVSGISLRTIQRVEATGKTSKETLMALSVALNISVQDLIDNPISPSSWFSIYRVGLGVVISVVFSLAYMSLVTADEGLKLAYTYEKVVGENSYSAEVEYFLLFDESATADITGATRIGFHGREVGESIELSVSLYDYLDETDAVFVGSSIATVNFGEPVSFTFKEPTGPIYKLVVIPTRATLDI